MSGWLVYILECSDGTFYTGITNDLDKRLATHNAGKGAKYTRSRLPVELMWFNKFNTKNQALKKEAAIKKLSREQKEKIIYEGRN